MGATQKVKKGGKMLYKNLEHLRLIKRPFELMPPEDEGDLTGRTGKTSLIDDFPVEESQIMNNLFYMD
jgi:hypothetical protein